MRRATHTTTRAEMNDVYALSKMSDAVVELYDQFKDWFMSFVSKNGEFDLAQVVYNMLFGSASGSASASASAASASATSWSASTSAAGRTAPAALGGKSAALGGSMDFLAKEPSPTGFDKNGGAQVNPELDRELELDPAFS